MDEVFSLRRFYLALLAFAVVVVAGAIGFHWLLGEDWSSSVYRSVVTISLTGLDSKPEGTDAEIFTIVLLFAGVAIFLYLAGAIVELIARGVVGGALADRRRRRTIERLGDHYIICGYGRVGHRVAAEFRDARKPYVVLDFNVDAIAAAREAGELLVEGNGTHDEDLEAAGLARARGLVASSDSDVDNLYIVLSARAARPDLLIVARASNEDAAAKFRLAGADRIVQPYTAAGQLMANLMMKPQVTAFVDIVTSAGGDDFRFEEIEVTAECGQAGRTIKQLRIRSTTGALIVAIRKHDGTLDTTPSPNAVLDVGDVMVAAGTRVELEALEELFAPREEAVAG